MPQVVDAGGEVDSAGLHGWEPDPDAEVSREVKVPAWSRTPVSACSPRAVPALRSMRLNILQAIARSPRLARRTTVSATAAHVCAGMVPLQA